MMDWEVRLRQRYAIVVRPEWLEQVMAQLHAAHPDLSTWPEDRVFEKIFTAFLFCDLNQAGSATLPTNTKEMHKEVLMGKFVLQLDEVINMAAAARERYTEQPCGRCLKFALTDGCQQVVGVEHAHLPTLTWDCPAGSKVLIHNVPIRRGMLLLGPDNTALLGGQVERLEAARQRAVAAWTKPVVGRPAGSAPRDIFAEARQAAWAPGAPTTGPPGVGPSGAAAGAWQQGASAGAQPQGAVGQAPLASGAAAGPGMAAAVPPAQQRPPAPPQQAPHQQRPPPAAWQMPTEQQPGPQPQGIISGIQGQALATGGGAGAAAAAPAPAARPLWQQQQQGWHLKQPQAVTQPRAPAPPTQAGAQADAPAGPPWLGRSANATLGGSGSAGNQVGMSNANAAALSSRPGLALPNGVPGSSAGAATSFGGTLSGGGVGGVGGSGSRGAPPMVDLVTSSDSGGSADSQSRSSNDQPSQRQPSNSHLALQQPQPQPHVRHQQPQPQQEPPLRRRLPPSSLSAGTSLLGGSTAAPPAAGAGASAAPGLGLSTFSSDLLPPRPANTAAAQRAGPSGLLPSVIPPTNAAVGSGTTAGLLRKPALPLARSSPGQSGSLGCVGQGGAAAAAAPSPTTSTVTAPSGGGPVPGAAAQRSLFPASTAAAGAGLGAGVRGTRGAGLAVDVDMVDLAALDDDDGDDGGEVGAAGGGALSGNAAGPVRDTWQLQQQEQQQQRAQGCKAKLQPPLDPAGRTEKRPRLLPGQPAKMGAAEDVMRATRMDVDLDAATAAERLASGPVAAGAGALDVEQWHGGAVGTLSRRYGPAAATAAPAAAVAHHPVESMAVEVDSIDSEMTGGGGSWDSTGCGRQGLMGPGSEDLPPAEPGAAAAAAAAAGPAGYVARHGQVEADAVNYAGVVMLCQVPDLLHPDPETDASGVFPFTVDVYGLFHGLDADTATIEDGSAVVEAQLTDRALGPFLADVEPPAGLDAAGPIGLAEIQAMADSLDPAVQAYGQDLAARFTNFIRDFSGIIRLEYREPPPTQPLIVRLINDEDQGPAGGCQVYEQFLQDSGALRADDQEAGEPAWQGE
ncbi:recQ-mediated genome instability protein 1 [Pleodorina starrii]|uniref:RecQ-mediated genome instability protein 1 n=1 Tax=Pleodorina starrii TaxID=330485 RepID=A0A9W6BHE4_9CHLO|nr:recQ-mediated genome instability protein 1 [Pleodorina starrii]GLC51546.1 recQ-mediated genome instability protein 1 [Pleodorina starrii]GLC72313.1 recQ-mediated genome instability protein 1 [Pleodorina starrii]